MQSNNLISSLTRDELQDLIINSVKEAFINNQSEQESIDDTVPVYVSRKDAASLISVCKSTIDNAANAGRLRRYNVGKAVRFEREQVLGLVRSYTRVN